MKNYLHYIFAVFFFLPISVLHAQTVKTPEPPFKQSEVGYLYTAKGTEVPSPQKKMFVQSQTDMYLFQENDDTWIFAIPLKDNTILVNFPKTKRYQSVFFRTDNQWFRTRSLIEVDTVAFPLPPGTELPLKENTKDSRIAFYRAGQQDFFLNVPLGIENIAFSKKTQFEIFSELQKSKGLTLYNGQWIDSAKADSLKNAEKEAKSAATSKMELLRKTAETGYLILSDGQIVPGQYRGGDNDSILFELKATGETKIFTPDNVANIPLEEAMALANIKKLRDIYSTAMTAYRTNRYGDAAKALAELEKQIALVPENISAKGDSPAKIKEDAKALFSDLKQTLEKAGLALYDFKTFKKDVLANHLAEGHILFRESVWLEPSQVCRTCSGKGIHECPECRGKGSLSETCTNCEGKGTLVCPLCSGTGKLDCTYCNGKGYNEIPCSQCNGLGLVRRLTPRRPTISIIGNAPVVIPGGAGGYYYSPEYIDDYCRRCNGAGKEKVKCSYCGGRGFKVCPTTVKCNYCSGKGEISYRCQTCGGKRAVTCETCSGKGYNGEPQPDKE